jgi:hypothetical protein
MFQITLFLVSEANCGGIGKPKLAKVVLDYPKKS